MPCVAIAMLEKSAAAGLRVLLAGAMLSISPVAALAAGARTFIQALRGFT